MTVAQLVSETDEVEIVPNRPAVTCVFSGKRPNGEPGTFARVFGMHDTEAFTDWVADRRAAVVATEPVMMNYGHQEAS